MWEQGEIDVSQLLLCPCIDLRRNESGVSMAFPKIIGSETEYGLTIQHDPEFDPIATALLLVNSYNADQSLKLLWDYDQEEPLSRCAGV